MFEVLMTLLVAATAMGVSLVIFKRRDEQRRRRGEDKAALAGDLEVQVPVSLHPVINPDICIGSFSCLEACPEGRIVGVSEVGEARPEPLVVGAGEGVLSGEVQVVLDPDEIPEREIGIHGARGVPG